MECYLNTFLLLNNETARSRLHIDVLQNLYSSPNNILHHHHHTKVIEHEIFFCHMDVRFSKFFLDYILVGGRENVVGIATRYGLEVPRVESL